MNPQSATSNALVDPQNSIQPLASTTSEGSTVSTAADRMYQIAALTAGIFLLATLL